jgi:protein TonB
MKSTAVSDDDWVPPFPSTSAYYCPAMLPPKPVATPLPALPKSAGGKVKVRFVIGIDGRLHKLAVLSSAGRAVDIKAVKALQRWRYQPATCNGVPMEAEGSVEFPLN